jgi:iron complex transport system substrate-binding protein
VRTGRRRGLWGLLLAALLLAALPTRAALEAVDDRGRRVRLDAPPQRIVSMLPSLTETVCALGACDRLVAVDDFSNWPASVGRLPRVGGLEDAQVEAIVALRPDLVLLAGSTRALPRLERLGLKVLALEPRSLADFQRVAVQLDAVLGTGRARALWQQVQDELDQAARAVPPRQRGQRVYVEVGSGPYAAGAASFVGELLARVGGDNIVAAAMGPFPRLNPEFVVRADPQVILLTDGRADLAARPGWPAISAVREGRVCRFTPAQADLLVRPGPRLGQGAALVADCLLGRWRTTP